MRKEAERELKRLERLPPAAPDYQVIRTYLELVLELPWHKRRKKSSTLRSARQVLDEDHYDLKEVKERILEHLAVLKLNPRSQGADPVLRRPAGRRARRRWASRSPGPWGASSSA